MHESAQQDRQVSTPRDRPVFTPAVEEHHHRVDAAAYEDIYVVGDVHGCLPTLKRLLARLDPGPEDLVVFVGDLVRKGPDSRGVLNFVRERENFLSVRGNNEQGLIEGSKSDPALDDADVASLESFPLAVSWDDVVVVHGGIDHRKALTEHSAADLLNMRSLSGGGYERPYWFECRSDGPQVFFGHTVLAESFETPWAVGLDTGCVYGGRLTAYDYRNRQFVSVPPAETHQDRSDDSIVTPRPGASAEE